MTLDREHAAQLLPGYEVGRELGRGGWGVVLAGKHKRLGRKVAIKQLPRAFGDDPAVRSRFLAEAQLLASLDHPHIVPIYDFVEGDGLCLLVMEELPGGTVWERFATDGLTMPSACSVALATCAALACAHDKGILHRDVKPENVMFSSGDAVKVTDFGIAKVLGGGETLATVAGEVLGTPAYMAPEQAMAGSLTPATDIYSAGVMLYELLSGELPFLDDGNALAVIHRHVYEEPTALSDTAPDVPPPLADAVMRSLATAPEDRYSSAEQFGVAVAEAATAAWGPGWLADGDYRVMAAGEMVAVTERPTGRPRPPASRRSSAPRPRPTARAPQTAQPGRPSGRPPRRARQTPPPRPSASPERPSQPIRPSVSSARGHTAGSVPPEALGVEFVPLHRVAQQPVLAPALLAVGLAVLVLLVAVVGLGSESRSGDLEALAVAGFDPGSATPKLALEKPVPISLPAAGGVGENDTVRLKLSAGGVPLGSGDSPLQRAGQRLEAEVNVSASRYLVAGRARGRVEVVRDGAVVAHRSFPVRSDRSALLTLPALATAALLLFIGGYVESLSRTLRRRRARVGPTIGMVLLGAAFGIAAVGVAWVLVGREPLATTLAVCVVIGGGAGMAAAIASGRAKPRRRRAGFR